MFTRKNIIIGILSIIVIVCIYTLVSSQDIAHTPPKNPRIVAFGDSLISGVGSTKGNDFISQVSREIKMPIINLGIPGNTTADALKRINSVLAYDPGTVIILLGGNDYLKRVESEETWSNLDTIVKTFHDKGIAVIVLGVRGGLIKDNFEDRFEDLTKKYQTGYVPNVLDEIIFDRNLMYDTVHPNDMGYTEIAQRVVPVLHDVFNK